MSSPVRDIAKNVSIVGSATLLSRVFGFFRDLVVAYVLGAGPAADAFYVAFKLPNMMRRLFAEGSMTMAFVPIFSRLREEEGDQAAFAMARSVLMWLLSILSVVTVLALAFARPLTLAIAPGFTKDPVLFDHTVTLVRIIFPYIIQISAVALCMGVLNSLGHFFAPAMATSELNTVLILGALASLALGVDPSIGLAWSVLAGGLGQWFLQQPYIRRHNLRWIGPWSWRDKGVARMARLMLPTTFGAAIYQLNIMLSTLLASFLPQGSISYLYYADRLVQFPLGLFGAAIGTVALPSLAKLAASGKIEEFTEALSASIRLTAFICLPAAAGLIGLAAPMVAVLFGRGAFTLEAALATSRALLAYGVGLPAFACVRPVVAAYFALGDTKTPVWVGAACLAVNIGLGAALMFPLAHSGLALASSISSWVNFLLLARLLRGRLGAGWLKYGRTTRISFALSLLVGAASYATSGHGAWSLALIIPLAAIYMVLAYALRVEEAVMLWEFFSKRLANRRAGKLARKNSKPGS
ncbi:MAG: murein biosynthesis integral membrane protein MurJ [Desulfovibrionaceae bacterium]|nr:murein biosynthesis integral membrane protein MurJ [Desulfovibrionaceae bacterium]MBF0514755.1 murein biosynthesis integral membrane protein MurJ [Desulfovibrionaceae bacterium]